MYKSTNQEVQSLSPQLSKQEMLLLKLLTSQKYSGVRQQGISHQCLWERSGEEKDHSQVYGMVERKQRGRDRKKKEGGNSLQNMSSAFGILFTIFLPFTAAKSVQSGGGKGERYWSGIEETIMRKVLQIVFHQNFSVFENAQFYSSLSSFLGQQFQNSPCLGA